MAKSGWKEGKGLGSKGQGTFLFFYLFEEKIFIESTSLSALIISPKRCNFFLCFIFKKKHHNNNSLF